jgi:hypothetical protein
VRAPIETGPRRGRGGGAAPNEGGR